jgi:hypothetical protein
VGFEEKASYAKMLVGVDVNAAAAEPSGTPKPRVASLRKGLRPIALPGRGLSSTLPSRPTADQ